MIEKAKNLLKNEAVSGTIIVAIASLIGNVFSYLVQIFLGRSLTVAEYGIFNTLLSVSVIIGVFNGTLTTAVVKLVSDLKVKERFDTLTHLFVKISVYTLGLGIIIALGVFSVRNTVADFLNIAQISIVSAFALNMSTPFLRIAPAAYLQGLLRFKGFGFFTVISSILRLAVVFVAIYLGYRVGGVYVALSIGSLISYFVGALVLKKNFTSFDKNSDLNTHYKRMLIFAGPVLFIRIGMILLNNVDIILVKHLFDEYSAGLYSGLVTVAKVFLFGANTITIVMFPQVSEAFAKREDFVEKVKPFFLLQVFVILVGLVVFKLFPGLIVDIMFGEEYMSIVKYLPKFVLFFAFYVMLNFVTMFLLAIEKVRVYLLQIPAIILQVVLIYLFHDNLNQVIDMNLISSGLLLVLVSLFYLKNVGINYSSSLQAGKDN